MNLAKTLKIPAMATLLWEKSTSRKTDLLYGFMIFAATLAVYSGCVHSGFLVNWDDPNYVTANPVVQSVTMANIKSIFTTFYVGNYAPMQMFSYMLDYSWGGGGPRPFILVNVILHGLNAFLFFKILCHLKLSRGWALLSALFFTVHPVQVESVAWISQRKNVLAMAFFLPSFWYYLAYVRHDKKMWVSYLSSLFFFLLALLTKSVVVILPALLLAYDFTLREKKGRLLTIVIEKIPYGLLAVGASWLALISQGNEGGIVKHLPGGSAFAATLTMLTVYKEYLFNLFYPLQLSAFYDVKIKTGVDGEVLWSAFLFLATAATLWSFPKGKRQSAIFWLTLFFLGLAPVSQIIPMVTLMHDRYLYFPMLGFSVYFILLLKNLGERFRPGTKAFALLIVASIGLLTPVAWQRTGVWASSLSLWQDAVSKEPDSAQAWQGLADSQGKSRDYPAAIKSYIKALSLDSYDFETNYGLGVMYQSVGDYEKSIPPYRNAYYRKPSDVNTLYNLGLSYTIVRKHPEAVEILEQGVRVSPSSKDMLLLLAANHYYQNDYDAARQAYTHALDFGSGVAEIKALLALVALRQGDGESSSRLWQETLISGRTATEIYLDWARLEAVGLRREEALKFLAQALTLGVKDPAALYEDPDFNNLKGDATFIKLLKR